MWVRNPTRQPSLDVTEVEKNVESVTTLVVGDSTADEAGRVISSPGSSEWVMGEPPA